MSNFDRTIVEQVSRWSKRRFIQRLNLIKKNVDVEKCWRSSCGRRVRWLYCSESYSKGNNKCGHTQWQKEALSVRNEVWVSRRSGGRGLNGSYFGSVWQREPLFWAKLKAVPVLINLFKRYLAGYVMSAARTCEGRLNGPLQIHGRYRTTILSRIGTHEMSARDILLAPTLDTIVLLIRKWSYVFQYSWEKNSKRDAWIFKVLKIN